MGYKYELRVPGTLGCSEELKKEMERAASIIHRFQLEFCGEIQTKPGEWRWKCELGCPFVIENGYCACKIFSMEGFKLKPEEKQEERKQENGKHDRH